MCDLANDSNAQVTVVERIGGTIHRGQGPWSEAVHRHIEQGHLGLYWRDVAYTTRYQAAWLAALSTDSRFQDTGIPRWN